jgi:hypothetical protein
MTRNHGPVAPLRPASPAGFSDTAAMDDIQALLASPRRPPGDEALEEIAEIVARTGRALVAPRDFTVDCEDDEHGLPYVAVRSEGTTVRVGQDPVSGTVRIAIRAATDAERGSLDIQVNGRRIPRSFGRPPLMAGAGRDGSVHAAPEGRP